MVVLVATPAAAPAATAATVAGTGASGGAAAAGVVGGGDSLTADRSEAAQIAETIAAQGRQLDQLSEQADAAAIYRAQVATAQAGARRALAATDARLATARRVLVEQALAAYTDSGEETLTADARDLDDTSPDLIGAYGTIVASGEHDAVVAYKSLRHQQVAGEARLAAAASAAAAAAATLSADSEAAVAAEAAERTTLAGVQGHLAVLVAQAQATAARAASAEEEQALTEQGQALAHAPATPVGVGAVGAGAAAGAGGHRPRAALPGLVPGRSAGPAVTPRSGAATTVRPAPPAPSKGPAPITAPTSTAAPATVPPPTTVPPTTSPAPPPTSPTTTAPPVTDPGSGPGGSAVPPQAPGAATALAYARAQIGKPYQWGGAGPGSFDCSGLVMMAWSQAGVSFPHLAQDQYDMTARESLAQAEPGDLVFFGTPSDVYHVGIYIGGGEMIDAPETGQDVSVQGIYWSDLLGAGRVTG